MESPVYRFGLSPAYIWTLRLTVGAAGIMTLLSLIFCFVRGMQNDMFFLLAANILMTGLLAAWNIWNYNRGYMDVDKHWFLLVVCVASIWQCIAADIYVFSLPSKSSSHEEYSSLNYTTYVLENLTTLVTSSSSSSSSSSSGLLSTLATKAG